MVSSLMKISDSFGRTDSATSHQNFNRFFLWFALGMMTESMSEFVTPTVPVLQEVVNQEMAIITGCSEPPGAQTCPLCKWKTVLRIHP